MAVLKGCSNLLKISSTKVSLHSTVCQTSSQILATIHHWTPSTISGPQQQRNATLAWRLATCEGLPHRQAVQGHIISSEQLTIR
jgi:hypothetical protein